MKKKHIATLLVLILVISPIASAFACRIGPGHLEKYKVSNGSIVADALIGIPMPHDKKQQDSQGNQSNLSCHSSGNCVFHLCSDGGLTSSIRFITSNVSNFQNLLIDTLLKRLTRPPELRPPIRIL